VIHLSISDSHLLCAQWTQKGGRPLLTSFSYKTLPRSLRLLQKSESEIISVLNAGLHLIREDIPFEGEKVYVTIPNEYCKSVIVPIEADMTENDGWELSLWSIKQRWHFENSCEYFGRSFEGKTKSVFATRVSTIYTEIIKLAIQELGGEPLWMGSESSTFFALNPDEGCTVFHLEKNGYRYFHFSKESFENGKARYINGKWKLNPIVGSTSNKEVFKGRLIVAGKLSNKNLDELIAGSRVEVSKNKKNPEDFVLWKPSKDKEPYWESPWGKGRPGWHLECSVMSKKYLGNKFDIHGGGRDLIFPHHENEIAQSRCANENEIFANYWIHNGFITMSNEKMAKSQGNILKINELKKQLNGQVLRLALMSAHYRQPLDWSENLINQCQNTLNKWYESYVELKKQVLIPDEYLNPLYDDLNTPGYISNLHKLFEKSQKGDLKDKEIFISACNFVGLLKDTKNKWVEFKKSKSIISEQEILDKIDERNKARDKKNYKLADKIRNELLDKGVLIEDKDDKTSWKLK